MVYIILGKQLRKGTIGDDSSDLTTYFELGWEVVGSRFDIIDLLQQRLISEQNVTLVTTKDRKFFYTKFYSNTIVYDDFLQKVKKDDIVHDWTKKLNFNFLDPDGKFLNLETKKYIHHDRDYELIFNGFDLSDSKLVDFPDIFIVVCLRQRDHSSGKNSNFEHFEFLISMLKEHITKNIFVIGYGTEEFCKKNECVYLDRLVDFVTLIKNKNCITFISQSTGPFCLALTCSETHIQLIDHSECSEINGNNAVLGGKCVHFFSNGITPYYSSDKSTMEKIFNKTKELFTKKMIH